ncbi:MAG: GDP-mannose 4,6-dehydratase [Verrucomicrobiota bacterium]
MRILITGAGGFIGSWLSRTLVAENHEVHGWHHRAPARPISGEQTTVLDITNAKHVSQCIQELRPEIIFHLAAQSFPGKSWENPDATFRVNVGGTFNLLHATLDAAISPRIISVCSSAEYAPGTPGIPIREDSPLAPSNPYGHSKLIQDNVSESYGIRLGLDIIRVRPFFLIGPEKSGDVCSDFSRRFIEAETNHTTSIAVGNMAITRDFLDIRDGIRALILLSQRGTSGEVYNICAGRGYRIGDVFDALNEITHLGLVATTDPNLLRTVDELIKVGDPTRLINLGWNPSIPFKQSIRDILDYWKTTSHSSSV